MVAFNSKDFGAFVGNTEVEQEGIWFPVTAQGEAGPMFKLAFANAANPQYAAAFEKEFRKHRKLMQANGGNLPKALADPLMIRIFTTVIVRDWKNVLDEEKKPVVFNQENVSDMLTTYPRLLEMLIAFAKEPEYFSDSALVVDENDLGNSKKSSRGGLNTGLTPNT